MPKRPTPCPKRKSVNSQEELMAKLIFFSRASRGVSLLFPSPGLSEKPSEDPSFGFPSKFFFSALRAESSPMKAFPIMCPGLKPIFSLRFARCMFFFFSPDASFPTNRMVLPGLPHEQICSTWASERTELLYLGFPTNRSCLPELPHEQNYSIWASP